MSSNVNARRAAKMRSSEADLKRYDMRCASNLFPLSQLAEVLRKYPTQRTYCWLATESISASTYAARVRPSHIGITNLGIAYSGESCTGRLSMTLWVSGRIAEIGKEN